jgi:hypothetical protein
MGDIHFAAESNDRAFPNKSISIFEQVSRQATLPVI